VPFPTWQKWFGRKPSGTWAASAPARLAVSTPAGGAKSRSALRVGIPRVLNVWSTHQFWIGCLTALGIAPENIVFSSETSEEQFREFGKGRGAVDCCYPVKCMSGHYGELVFGQREKIDVLLSPLIYTLPSFLRGHVQGTYACTRVMAGPENIKAGFLKEEDLFARNGIRYVSPFLSLGEPELVPGQMLEALGEILDVDAVTMRRGVEAGYRALAAFDDKMRRWSRELLTACAREARPCVLVLARPYHLDPGIGHEIEGQIQAAGFPILWAQYLPLDSDILDWLFEADLRAGRIPHALDISDAWLSSYSGNTNEILWGAKFATRCPWITCVLRLSSYECGMDQPTFTPVQRIVEASGTLLFKFGDLDATRPTGSLKIRVETIVHYLQKHSSAIIERKLSYLEPCPWLDGPATSERTATSPGSGAGSAATVPRAGTRPTRR
jgi:predicted nucleotide-binding protein (sugar kinase/HSP70/actin superfamily)